MCPRSLAGHAICLAPPRGKRKNRRRKLKKVVAERLPVQRLGANRASAGCGAAVQSAFWPGKVPPVAYIREPAIDTWKAYPVVGNLKVSDNGRFLLEEDGSPFFYLGDTAWRLLYKLDRGETDHYLADRAAKGFNVIQMVVLDTRFGPNQYGEHAFHDNDVTRPNEKFFEHVDYVVERCAELGMRVGMLPN